VAVSLVGMILVTGATGTIGSAVVRELTAKGVPLRAMSRRGAGPSAIAGDFDRPETLAAAAAGVDTLFLLAPPGPGVAKYDLALLDAARTQGVRRVVKLSAIGPANQPGGWHHPGEAALRDGGERDSGPEWTILRPTTFASNSLAWAAAIGAGESVANPFGPGTQGVVDPDDVAAVAVAALLGDGHAGQTYTLTGPELLSLPDQVAQLGAVLGRVIGVTELEQVPPGLPAEVAAGVAYVREGRNAVVTEDVARVLGRPPRTFRQWAAQHRDLFQS
jgi:uncharacterized protein YbjT (DUF2867 family)